ncbi:hypothetical protein Pdw03_8829 [Penicillium digitatum]|uniref:Uncharacterized protein n=1 Tax=Penicillium digitatum TaxID=36651 RepID=A0A7T6XPB8_PENDI|nr:hypothetical protein Pdw03_8829 [Penicillium digitatum]
MASFHQFGLEKTHSKDPRPKTRATSRTETPTLVPTRKEHEHSGIIGGLVCSHNAFEFFYMKTTSKPPPWTSVTISLHVGSD